MVIAYHIEQTNDPFYNLEGHLRANYYFSIVIPTPTTFFDGRDSTGAGLSNGTVYPEFWHTVTTRLNVSSPLIISLDMYYDDTADTGVVTANIENTTVSSISGLLHFVLVENDIPYNWYAETEVDFVVRDMLPNQNGESVTIPSTDTIIRSRNFTISGGWDETNCKIVVFVQTSDKVIQQGAEIAVVQEPEMVYYGMIPNENFGNGNDFAEPGETFDMKVLGKNFNDGSYTGGASISTADTYITITSTNPRTVSIGPGDVDTVIDFTFDIAPGCPDPHEVTFELDFGSPVDSFPFIVTTEPGFSDDVESGVGGWTHSGTFDNWHITDHKSNSPTHSWYCGQEGSWLYTNQNDASLVSPYFVATPDSSLTFYHQYEFERDHDFGYIEIDNGSGWWKTLEEINRTAASWTQATYALSEYNAQTIRIRFRFISDFNVTQEGWYIDDVVMPTEVYVDITPPSAPYVAEVGKSGANAILKWNKITTDTLGYMEYMDYYVVYRDTFLSFIPSASDSIGAVLHPDTTYTDLGVLDSADNYYYLVKAVDETGHRSKKSNMGYKLNRFFNYNTDRSSRNWVSLPWHSGYSTVSDLVADLSPNGDPLESVTNLRDDMVEETWLYDTDFMIWYGPNNFTIEPGRGYEMVATKDTSLVLVGSNNPDGLISFNYNTDRSSRNWVSIPYNAAYSTVDDIAQEYSPAGDPLESITNLRDDMVQETWLYDTDFMIWYGPNDFAIVPGRGYEFVPIKDTTWNPNEWSNEAFALMLAQKSVKRSDVEIYSGQSLEPDRAPVWIVKESEKRIDYSDAKAYTLVTEHLDEKADYREPGISHIVRVHLNVKEFDNLVFTAYRPEQPYDVLTEKMIGSCVAIKGDQAAFFFNVSNFKQPWQDKEEVIIIIEATKQGRGYFTVVNVFLDERVDIQDVDDITLTTIPEPVNAKGLIRWHENDNDNVMGYSLYQDDRRINHKVITEKNYSALGEVYLKPVIIGGYETVYNSQNPQSMPNNDLPISYAFNTYPNPFAKKTSINYAVPQPTLVDIKVYDVGGRQVKRLVSEKHEPGYYQIHWFGDDDMGRKVASGIYFIRMNAKEFESQHKVIFVH